MYAMPRCWYLAVELLLVASPCTTGSGGRATFTPPPPPSTPQELFVDHARHGRFAEVRALRAAGVNPNVFSDDKGPGYTALHWAALNGSPKMAAMLIEMGADVNARHKSGNTPLHFAALDSHPDVAQVLVEAGADLEPLNNADFTPLDAATDTIEGRFRGPDPTAAAIVKDVILDAKSNPSRYGRNEGLPPLQSSASTTTLSQTTKKRRRIKKKPGDSSSKEL